MPALATDKNPGLVLAVVAEGLYVLNLLIFPGLAFVILAWLWLKGRRGAAPLARAHLAQAMAGSLWAWGLFLAVIAGVWATLGLDSVGGMLILEFYFILGHGSFVVLGMIGAIKAVGGLCWRFPLIGPALPPGCP